MASEANIKAFARTDSGKGVARKLRDENKVPAVIYSAGKEPQSVALDGVTLGQALRAGHFYTRVHTVDIDGKALKVLAKDIQYHPVTDNVLHIDFMHYNAKATVTVQVSIKVIGQEDSPGLKKGGVLQLVASDIELSCRADSIPEEIVISIAGKDIGDSVHMHDITLPEGVTASVSGEDVTLASIVGTRTSTMADLDDETAAEASEGAEGEASSDDKAEGEEEDSE